MDCIEQYEHEGVTVQIFPDDRCCGDSPREWCNASRLYCWDDRMSGVVKDGEDDEMFGRNDHDDLGEAVRWLIGEGAVVILPLYLLDHSGYSLSYGENLVELDEQGRARECESTGRFIGDSAGWDTTMVGFCWVPKDSDATDPLACAKAEMDTLDQYFTGDVYGYVVAPGDALEESCWGFYGIDTVREEANGQAACVSKALEARRERCLVRGEN